MSHVQQAKLVLSRLIDRLRILRARAKNADDTVESQAETLRIWMWASAAGLALIVVATILSRESGDNDGDRSVNRNEPVAMADQLPNGFVLVPIEPTNLESLDSIFGQHGYADLYRADGSQQRGQRLARGVALVRSPRNPRRFAVLIEESESAHLSQLAEPVLVILRKGPAQKIEREIRTTELPKKRVSRKIDLIEEAEPEVISLNDQGETL